MSLASVLFLCIACVIQVAFSSIIASDYYPALGGVNLGNNAQLGAPDVAAVANLPVTGPYGGTGTGEMAVVGEVQASGQTIVTGQVPVIGQVTFSGTIPASGIVSVAGNCGCGNNI